MDAIIIVLAAGFLGLAFGSFANVAIHRWPRHGSVRDPARSHCPTCGAELAARDNVPVLSWLRLGGRCRHCGEAISRRYPMVELGMGVLFALVALRQPGTWALPALLTLTWALVVAAAIDLEHRIIPNLLTYRLPVVLGIELLLAAALEPAWGDLRRALVFAVVLPGSMLLLSEAFRLLRGKAGIGMGDVKLAISLGLALGWLGGAEVVGFLYLSIIAAVLVAIVLMATGRARLASRIPFGPYLAIGAIAAILGGDDLAGAIQAMFGL